MRVMVIGHLGNMGQRYVSILKHARIPWCGLDVSEHTPVDEAPTHVIIATPTTTHIGLIKSTAKLYPNVPILCEKPISTDLEDLQELPSNLYMVNNYQYMPIDHTAKSLTLYDYYKSGDDGLEWDCIQLIGLANSKIELAKNSPIWTVILNGQVLDAKWVDHSYIGMIRDFTGDMQYCWGVDKIKEVHEKVMTCLK